jgi:hypothetical protein
MPKNELIGKLKTKVRESKTNANGSSKYTVECDWLLSDFPMPLNVITLGQKESENINHLIFVTGYFCMPICNLRNVITISRW